MIHSIARLIAAAAICAGANAQVANATDATTPAIIVSSLAASPAAVPAAVLNSTIPAEINKIQQSIVDHQTSLDGLSKQLEEGLRQKQRLILSQRLMASILSLKRARRVLKLLDARVEQTKTEIKGFGEQAEQISDSIRRAVADHKKQLADLNTQLGELRKNLNRQQKRLTKLTARRGRVAKTVRRWRAYVARLRQAHDAASVPAGTFATADPFAVPEPPSSLGLSAGLNAIFNSRPRSGVPFEVPASEKMPALDALVDAHRSGAEPAAGLTTAAYNDIAKNTFQALGQVRFKSLRGAAAAETDVEAEAETEVDAEAEAEVDAEGEEGVDLEAELEAELEDSVDADEDEEAEEGEAEEFLELDAEVDEDAEGDEDAEEDAEEEDGEELEAEEFLELDAEVDEDAEAEEEAEVDEDAEVDVEAEEEAEVEDEDAEELEDEAEEGDELEDEAEIAETA